MALTALPIIKLENARGQVLNLSSDPRYYAELTGTGPPPATINHSKIAVADGTRYNSATVDARPLVLTIDLLQDVGRARLNLYKWLVGKAYIKVYHKWEDLDVWVEGYVETVETDPHVQGQTVQASIICPYPFWQDVGETVSDASDVDSLLEFPLSTEVTGKEITGLSIQGATTQSGTGDPSPENIREIIGVGVYDGCVVLDGSDPTAVTATAIASTLPNYRRFRVNSVDYNTVSPSSNNNTVGMVLSNQLPSVTAGNTWEGMDGVCVDTSGKILFYIEGIYTVEALCAYLAENPLTIWYQKATHTEGDPYYTGVSVEDADGYQGYAVELAQPLMDGDLLECSVPSGVTLDGNTAFYGYNSTAWGRTINVVHELETPALPGEVCTAGTFPCFVDNADAWDQYGIHEGDGVALSADGTKLYIALTTETLGISEIVSSQMEGMEGVQAYLAAYPIAVWYKAAADDSNRKVSRISYTGTHKMLVLDGTEAWIDQYAANGRFILAASPAGVNNTAMCSHYKLLPSADSAQSDYFMARADYFYFYQATHTTLADWTAYLAAQSAAGTPVTILYKLATPEPSIVVRDDVKFAPVSADATVTAEGAVTVNYTDHAEGIEISRIDPSASATVINDGQVDTGVRFEIRATLRSLQPRIYNLTTGEWMGFYVDLFPGERLIINTTQGKKSVTHVVDGVESNYIGTIMPGSSWMQLVAGTNEFSYTVDEGEITLHVYHTNKYQGV